MAEHTQTGTLLDEDKPCASFSHVAPDTDLDASEWKNELNMLLDAVSTGDNEGLWREYSELDNGAPTVLEILEFTRSGVQSEVDWRLNKVHSSILGGLDMSDPEWSIDMWQWVVEHVFDLAKPALANLGTLERVPSESDANPQNYEELPATLLHRIGLLGVDFGKSHWLSSLVSRSDDSTEPWTQPSESDIA
ncbi:hypothetical protein BCR34DRAFT_584163 [Clohesyomyces aquaticus]|uniref:Uncharacterized protein n=1 Tax=Clohesyomyces aquaticus TaxID=1231657 RepID=A0A1Y2A2P3_9PLEO|nr:hypothetical protein BCR34DRAFT_584163 [Clohesyomyces aquaticus]